MTLRGKIWAGHDDLRRWLKTDSSEPIGSVEGPLFISQQFGLLLGTAHRTMDGAGFKVLTTKLICKIRRISRIRATLRLRKQSLSGTEDTLMSEPVIDGRGAAIQLSPEVDQEYREGKKYLDTLMPDAMTVTDARRVHVSKTSFHLILPTSRIGLLLDFTRICNSRLTKQPSKGGMITTQKSCLKRISESIKRS
ncbi:hypothetical protein HYPSUDRAFT_665741 [Hypholoma sublateritium FD-334 SS-4]|uniref:Uncharacterized protein n=1 Tax=Hypholoma sublateritium (strain FD-334 SS-4) TaxID=945553 RepID=A0A0D2NTE3_HYPSF|nr:hypothetical protein HYPSUDRAFT_665741 [Hypholoma sublateritium FD-334 SS-4]